MKQIDGSNLVLLITGATGKVGTVLINRLLREPRWQGARIRALCHNRVPAKSARVEVVRGDIADSEFVSRAIRDVTHVVHLATCKEIPEIVMDVTVKGLFWLLESFRQSPTARQFILIGGDAGVGHFFYDRQGPITEKTPHMAYPGSYALSKVLEEVMLEQFSIQYGLNTCCLRAPWIMEKDDFKYSLSFGDDLFGGPDWKTMVAPETAEVCRKNGTIPLLIDAYGRPLKRNFVHVDDLVDAIFCALGNSAAKGQLFNISMDAPVDYGDVAAHLRNTRNLGSININSRFHSNWMDNSKARFTLGWKPMFDMRKMVDASWSYQRAADDPRKVWYPG